MKRWRWYLGGAAVLALLVSAGILGVLRSDWLREQIRLRIIAETEKATGGKAQLGSFEFDWKQLRVAARGFILRGREPENAEPLFRAESIELRLNVLSWISRDIRLRSLVVEKPRVQILVAPDGATNLPQPKVPRKGGNPLEQLMRLKIGQIEIRQGWFHIDDRKAPFDVRASELDLRLVFDSAATRYRMNGAIAEVQTPGGFKPSVELGVWLDPKRVVIDKAELRLAQSRLTAAGEVVFSPLSVDATYRGDVALKDVPRLRMNTGTAAVEGKLKWAGDDFGTAGKVDARGIVFDTGSGGIRVEDVAVRGEFDVRKQQLRLRNVGFSSNLIRGSGEATIADWRDLEVSADLDSVDIERVQRSLLDTPYAWNGTAAGPVSLKGTLGAQGVSADEVRAVLAITPAEGQVPVSGSLSLEWDRGSGLLRMDGTSLATRETRMNVQGALGRELDVNVSTSSIRDVELVVAMLARDEKLTLPLRLEQGEAQVSAKVRGKLDSPVVSGRLRMRNARVDEVPFDSLDTWFDVDRNSLKLSKLQLKQSEAELSGRLSLELRDWRPEWSSAIDLSVRIGHAEIQKTLGLFRIKSPLSGAIDGTVEAAGPAGAPALRIRARGAGIGWGKEVVRKASVELATERDGAFAGAVTLDSMTGKLKGRLRHKEGDFQEGSARIEIVASEVRLSELESLKEAGPNIDGTLAVEVAAEAEFSPEGLRWIALDGAATSPEVRVNNRRLDKCEIRSATQAGLAALTLKCALRSEPAQIVNASARIRLNGEPLAEGSVKLPRISFAFLREVARPANEPSPQEPLPIRGFVEGSSTFSLNLSKPETLKAQVTVSRLQLRPRDNQLLETQVDSSDLALTNSSPIVIDIDHERAAIRSSSFAAKETELSLSGTLGFKQESPLNLKVSGGVNLAVLSTFRPEVEARGRAQLDATIRGTPADPSMSGKMTIAAASFFLKDLPNGIENANGTVFFERNRANIEKLTGQTGGGEFQITGFFGLNAGRLNYRLNAKGKAIRLRYPEGVSTTADAALDLVGEPARSLLSGTVTVLRSGFIGGGDFGEMMGGSMNPIPPPATRNEFLRNLQFDVKIRTAPDAILVSSYTEGLETEANLHLRGSPSKPILLGSIEVNQGTIRFFGNRYTISRGEMLFYNTAAVQPEIDLDLETRIRGVTVYIKVSGPLARLNVNYRSEPPLQSQEILALLTVGRAPTTADGSLQAQSNIRGQNVLENTSSNSLLGGALSAGISDRVERFFGASRIKIDPQATGVDNVAQARLSIEQSLSRDVTVTFVTNLSRTQEQIVRVEWDVSRQWQVIAVRDENGVFAVDFLFRKRFK